MENNQTFGPSSELSAILSSSSTLTELTQNSNLSLAVVRQILASSRLLIDHVECLEECLAQEESKQPKLERFTFLKSSYLVVGSFLWNFFMQSRLKVVKVALTTALSGYGLLYGVKMAGKIRNKIAEMRVANLIKCVARFESAIKRNILYFNEIVFIQSNEDETPLSLKQYERLWGCIESIKEVTLLMFYATKKLEFDHPLDEKLSGLYAPMEDLSECEYFRGNVKSYNPSNIKDFYNIFTYVQSQFLLRIGLSVSQNSFIPFLRTDISIIISKIKANVLHEEDAFRLLSAEQKIKKGTEISDLNKMLPRLSQCGVSAVLKETSLKVNSSITAIANECQKLDECLHKVSTDGDNNFAASIAKSDQLLNVVETMRNIEISLMGCCDDFHRLMLTYNKYLEATLHINPNLSNEIDFDVISLDEKNVENPSIQIKEVEPEPADEFYAYVEDENEKESNRKQSVSDIDTDFMSKDEKLTKKKFKPVLKQLKDRINPIREEMLEKERSALLRKGIDVEKLLPPAEGNNEQLSGSESGDSTDEQQSRRQKKPKEDHYEELRNFLSQKAPMNLFGIPPPPSDNVAGSEEILE